MIKINTISSQEANQFALKFSQKKNLLQLDEIDIKPLCNNKSLLLIETDSIGIILDDIKYSPSFKCCFIEGPEDLTIIDIQKIINQLPSENTVFGLHTGKKLHICYLVNTL